MSLKWFQSYYVMISFCNVLFSRVLFIGKVCALIVSIFCSFFLVSNFSSESPVLLSFLLSLTIVAVVLFITSCQQIFKIPTLMEDTKFHLLCNLHKICGNSDRFCRKRLILKLAIHSIAKVGVSDGGFRKMDSIYVLAFLDFYLHQIIALLLFFSS